MKKVTIHTPLNLNDKYKVTQVVFHINHNNGKKESITKHILVSEAENMRKVIELGANNLNSKQATS